MTTGKDKCELLKRIRKDVAEKYGLGYIPSECTHQGDYSGTCPKCDAELKDLQRQLESRGLSDIDFTNIPIGTIKDEIIDVLEGDVMAPSDNELVTVTMGIPAPPYTHKEKRRLLYKECQIAGITFHDLQDTWDELYEGAKLVLVRDKNNKYDKFAIAVALAEDYDGDPDDFDFDYILGYVPRTENQHLATMIDLGWSGVFECELSQVNGINPYKGSLYMKIYMVSKDEVQEDEDTTNLIRLLEYNKDEYLELMSDLANQGCTYFRCGGFPPWDQNFPKKGEKIVILYKEELSSVLYLMYCIAVGDDDASYFVKDKESLFAVDDCCYYVFTNIKGPISVKNEQLDFLVSEYVNSGVNPEKFLSESATCKLMDIIERESC